MLLVDSDWIMSGLGARREALDLFASLHGQPLAVSVVTVAEVFEGAYGEPDPEPELAKYRAFLAGFTVLDVTPPVVEVFARIRALLRKQGNLIPDLDLLIAATALASDLTLVTRNRRHFERIPDLKLHEPS